MPTTSERSDVTLESYLKSQLARSGATDFRLRFCEVGGRVRFYIHAIGHDSQTVDFELHGNELTTLVFSG